MEVSTFFGLRLRIRGVRPAAKVVGGQEGVGWFLVNVVVL